MIIMLPCLNGSITEWTCPSGRLSVRSWPKRDRKTGGQIPKLVEIFAFTHVTDSSIFGQKGQWSRLVDGALLVARSLHRRCWQWVL